MKSVKCTAHMEVFLYCTCRENKTEEGLEVNMDFAICIEPGAYGQDYEEHYVVNVKTQEGTCDMT